MMNLTIRLVSRKDKRTVHTETRLLSEESPDSPLRKFFFLTQIDPRISLSLQSPRTRLVPNDEMSRRTSSVARKAKEGIRLRTYTAKTGGKTTLPQQRLAAN